MGIPLDTYLINRPYNDQPAGFLATTISSRAGDGIAKRMALYPEGR